MTSLPTEVTHPLADAGGEGWVGTETRATVVALTPAMSDFLHRAATSLLRPIVVSGPHSRMTQPLREALTGVGGDWVVRTDAGGFYDARTGVVLDNPAQVLSLPRRASKGRIAPEFLRTAVSTRMRIVVSLSTRHRVSRTVRLGGTTESMTVSLTGAPPAAWGAAEPAVAPWDRDELTAYSRRRMPGESRWVAVGTAADPHVTTITIARTSEGLEETARLSVDRGAPGDPRQANIAEDARRALAAGAQHGMPLLGFAFGYVGAADLAQRPLAEPAPQPLALLIGPPAVRMTGIEPRRWAEELGAAAIGSPRLPGLLLTLGSAQGGGWERLGEVMAHVGADKMSAAFALAPRLAVEFAAAQDHVLGSYEGGSTNA